MDKVLNNLVKEFNEEFTYSKGSYVHYDDMMWECNEDDTGPGEFEEAKWTRRYLTDVLLQMNGGNTPWRRIWKIFDGISLGGVSRTETVNIKKYLPRDYDKLTELNFIAELPPGIKMHADTDNGNYEATYQGVSADAHFDNCQRPSYNPINGDVTISPAQNAIGATGCPGKSLYYLPNVWLIYPQYK